MGEVWSGNNRLKEIYKLSWGGITKLVFMNKYLGDKLIKQIKK